MTLGGLYQRRERQGDDRGGENRQQNDAADIEKGAEQQEENADRGGLTGRGPHGSAIVDRQRIADDQRMTDFALGADIFHWSLRLPALVRSPPNVSTN